MGKSRSLVSSCQNLKLYTGVLASCFWPGPIPRNQAPDGGGGPSSWSLLGVCIFIPFPACLSKNGWVQTGRFLSVCVPPGRGADTAGAPSSQEAGKCLWVSSSWKRFEALWQMFAVPATSLTLETEPGDYSCPKPHFVIDSWRVLPSREALHSLRPGEREWKERDESKMGAGLDAVAAKLKLQRTERWI